MDESKVEGEARFCKMHVLIDTQQMKIFAPLVTYDSVGNSTMLISLLGQRVVAIRKAGVMDWTPRRSKSVGPPQVSLRHPALKKPPHLRHLTP